MKKSYLSVKSRPMILARNMVQNLHTVIIKILLLSLILDINLINNVQPKLKLGIRCQNCLFSLHFEIMVLILLNYKSEHVSSFRRKKRVFDCSRYNQKPLTD